jgi:Fic family protein
MGIEALNLNPYIPDKPPLTDVDWESMITLIGKANRSLAFFDGVLQGVANPNLLLAPMTTQEAVISSRIEGTQATLVDVLKFEAGQEPNEPRRQEDIHEIINYRRALLQAEHELKRKPFNLNLLKDLHGTLLDSVRGRGMGRGKFRTVQNWVGEPGSPIDKAQYIPPDPLLLMEHLDNWEIFYHMEQPDGLAQVGIIHAQFEIIHPFLDGNGRLGRMLIPLFLFEKKLISRPMFYLSEYFQAHRDAYVGHLRELGKDKNAWNAWLRFFLLAVDQQAQFNTIKARAIIALYDDLKEQVLELTHSQFGVPLLDLLFSRPIFQISHLEGKKMPSRAMITQLVLRLKRAGIISVLREGSGRRGHVFALSKLINLTEGRKVV